MPTILDLFGLLFLIHTREHQPPHVHVRNQDGEAKFKVTKEEVILIENKRMKPKDLKLAESILEANKEYVVEQWVKIHG